MEFHEQLTIGTKVEAEISRDGIMTGFVLRVQELASGLGTVWNRTLRVCVVKSELSICSSRQSQVLHLLVAYGRRRQNHEEVSCCSSSLLS